MYKASRRKGEEGENDEVDERWRERAKRVGVGEEARSQKTEGKTEGQREREERRSDRKRERESGNGERVAPLQESEWTLPPGMFF